MTDFTPHTYDTGDSFTAAAETEVERELEEQEGQVADLTSLSVVNVKLYSSGHVFGVTDDTTQIEAAWTAAGNGHAIYFPPGDYIYNGTGLDAANYGPHASVLVAKGAGQRVSRIVLGASSYLFKPSATIAYLLLEDLWIEGGKGAICHTYTGADTVGTKHVNRCRFYQYTEAVVNTQASDSPFWFINECWFVAANCTSTMSVVLSSGLTDGCTITKCNFQYARIHIKAGSGGNNLQINECSFYEQDTVNTGGPRIAIWIVPSPNTNNGGGGCAIARNKFGAENMASGDYRIVYADEGSGSLNSTKFPNLAADSTGFVMGNTYSENLFRNTDTISIPIIYSTTPYVMDLAFENNQFFKHHDYILQYRTVPTGPQWLSSRNTFGPLYGIDNDSTNGLGPKLSNDPGAGYSLDPSQILQTRTGVVRDHSSGSSASFVQRLSLAIGSFTASGCSVSATTDVYGGSDATTMNITADYGGLIGALSSFIVGVPCWVELDVAQPADTPLSAVQLMVGDSSPSVVAHWFRILEIPSTALGWHTYAFNFVPRSVGSSPNFYIIAPIGPGTTSASRGKVKIGRPRVYQSVERVLGGRRPTLAATATDATTTQTLANSIRTTLIAQGFAQ